MAIPWVRKQNWCITGFERKPKCHMVRPELAGNGQLAFSPQTTPIAESFTAVVSVFFPIPFA
jgi:hypothetical protein